MNTLAILLTETRTEATIEILSMLVVAGIIGYTTAGLYYRSIFVRKIRIVETEKAELSLDFLKLKDDKTSMHRNLLDKDRELKYLKQEVHALKALHAEAVHETDDITLRNKRNEQLLYEKDEALIHIAKRRHLLNYKSFGTATAMEKDDLKLISGIGPFIEERLHALDIFTIRQISKFTARDIETINDAIEYFSGRIERDEWVAQAKEIIHNEDKKAELLQRISLRRKNIYYNRIGIAKKEEADDLTVISGIGGWIKEKLNVLDIYTFRQIANFTDVDVQAVTDAIEYFPGRIERDEWIIQAQEVLRIKGKKSELLMRIRERKVRIFYDRLGIAHKHQANNLTLIKGIGLWIEERLNLLDIFTFEQISRLTNADVETISEILEISPDRIDRENWVNQARALAKKQLQPVIN
jgi:predicted flap endonuclease-1-like 5' DNA nuclease